MSDLKRQQLTDEASFAHLNELFAKYGSTLNLRQLFAEDKQRFDSYKFFETFFKLNFKAQSIIILYTVNDCKHQMVKFYLISPRTSSIKKSCTDYSN